MKVRNFFRVHSHLGNDAISCVHVTKKLINLYIDNFYENKLVNRVTFSLKKITIFKKVSISKIRYICINFTHEKIYDIEYIFIIFSSQ